MVTLLPGFPVSDDSRCDAHLYNTAAAKLPFAGGLCNCALNGCKQFVSCQAVCHVVLDAF